MVSNDEQEDKIMARRKSKNLSIEELDALRKEAVECDEKIKALSDRKKELKQLIEQKQMEALYQAVQRSGKSIQEVIDLINSGNQAAEGQ